MQPQPAPLPCSTVCALPLTLTPTFFSVAGRSAAFAQGIAEEKKFAEEVKAFASADGLEVLVSHALIDVDNRVGLQIAPLFFWDCTEGDKKVIYYGRFRQHGWDWTATQVLRL